MASHLRRPCTSRQRAGPRPRLRSQRGHLRCGGDACTRSGKDLRSQRGRLRLQWRRLLTSVGICACVRLGRVACAALAGAATCWFYCGSVGFKGCAARRLTVMGHCGRCDDTLPQACRRFCLLTHSREACTTLFSLTGQQRGKRALVCLGYMQLYARPKCILMAQQFITGQSLSQSITGSSPCTREQKNR
jgi:hypothetical protein